MGDVAVRVSGLGKLYQIGAARQKGEGLRHALEDGVRRLFRLGEPARATEDFWALNDVSFEVRRGECVGVIGRNGAGKSTLLKVLSRITEPTTGEVGLRGRVGSLLEVGTGFHQELSGRENIYLNGSILGMSRREIARKFDEIVAFSEVEKFLDTPVKRYSSGMYVRLAFAVAAHLEPEILIVDEVLAVGDAAFQQKCLGKMGEVVGHGRTVLFVSHNMSAIQSLCTLGVVLEDGRLGYAGDLVGALARYSQTHAGGDYWVRADGAAPPLHFARAGCRTGGRQPALTLNLDLHLRGTGQHPPAFVAVDLVSMTGVVVLQGVPRLTPFIPAGADARPTDHRVEVEVELPPLIPGRYAVNLWCGSHNSATIDAVDSAVQFEVHAPPQPDRTFPYTPDHGYIAAVATCRYSRAEPSGTDQVV